MHVMEGTKEGSSIYYCGDGYYYYYHSEYGYSVNEGNCTKAYMRCIDKNKRLCQGAAYVIVQSNGEFLWNNVHRHTCAMDLTKPEVTKLKKLILEECTKTNSHYEPPSSLVNRCRNG